MNTEILTIMLVVSVLMGLIGLIAFLWGLKAVNLTMKNACLKACCMTAQAI